MKNLMVFAAAISTLAGCANSPDAVVAADLGPNAYMSVSCPELKKQAVYVQQNVENLSAAQTKAREDDTLGVILIGVPVSSMSGNDVEAQLSVAKGQLQDISEAQTRKNCRS